MDKGINSLLKTKTEQRKLSTLSEKDRRKYLKNKERQLEKFQELLYSRPSMNRSQQDIALMLAADRLRDLDLTTRETNKNKPTIESLDSEIQRLRTEKQMQQLNFANGGDTMDIKQQTQNVAAQGRYGDSMLMHVNPAEVKGLASALPLTVNPQTGQPEAFLPFLAPLIGSALGTSLLTAGGLAGLSMSPALAAGLGAGLATYAESGGSGSKALLSGFTAGIGTNSANTATSTVAGTTAGTEAATKAATQGIDLAGQTAASQAANTAAQAAYQPQSAFSALGDTFMSGPDGSFAFDQGAKALASGAASPSGMLAATAAGSRGIMESQEAFARQMGESKEEYRRRKEQNELMNPEPILYSAGGNTIGYYEGGRFGEIPDDITGGNLPQIYAPAKQAYDVNPDFMAGFAPETMYFNPATISAPASGLGAGGPPIAIDNYQGSKGGYGGRQASIAPQTSIDPFAAYTGSAPKGLEFTETAPPMPEIPFPINPITPPDFGIGVPDIGRIDIPNIGNIDIQSIIDQYGYDAPERAMTGMDLGLPMGEGTPMPAGTMMQANDLGALLPPGTDNGIDISDFLGSREDSLAGAQAMFGPQVTFATGLEPNTDSGMGLGLGEMMTAEELIARGGTPQPRGSGIFGKGPIVDSDVSIPANFMIEPPVVTRKEGGDTLKSIPEGNKGLPNLPVGVRKEMGYMQAGGMTDMQNDPLTQEVTMFILGGTDNEQALNDFITKYGSDAFMQLREMVLQSIVPDAQTQGLIQGDGEGGMDDDLRGMIGDKQRIAVSQDEFIVPADVVSMLGDGSSDAGSKELYDMMDRVRQEKTGTTKQAPKLANAGGMLPA